MLEHGMRHYGCASQIDGVDGLVWAPVLSLLPLLYLLTFVRLLILPVREAQRTSGQPCGIGCVHPSSEAINISSDYL